jgi:hypothetical protein
MNDMPDVFKFLADNGILADSQEESMDYVLGKLTAEELNLLDGDPNREDVRRTWAEWGPRFVAGLGQALWLVGMEHPSSLGDPLCPAPFPTRPAFVTTFASEGPCRPEGMVVKSIPDDLRCSNCWGTLRLLGNKYLFLIMSDRIINPFGETLV